MSKTLTVIVFLLGTLSLLSCYSVMPVSSANTETANKADDKTVIVYYDSSFSKWHHIPAGRELTEEEHDYAVSVLMAWIEKQTTV
jgi:hypothetical protein